VNQHSYEKRSEDHFRYMKYSKRTPEEHEASGFGQSTGHTDLGTVTLLFRQPVAGLQVSDAMIMPRQHNPVVSNSLSMLTSL